VTLVQAAQDRYLAAAQGKRVESDIKEGDSVFLNTANLPDGYANVSAESTKLLVGGGIGGDRERSTESPGSRCLT
jgi:hypothetical protein